MQKLNEAGISKKREGKITDFISKIVCRTKEERIFYKFSTNMIRNERTFKLKVYPGLGFGFIFPLLMLFAFSRGEGLENIGNSKMYFNMYLMFFSITVIVQYLKYSGDYKGAWVYKVMPIKDDISVYKGSLKAAFINLFTPLFLIVSIIFLFIFKLEIVLDIIVIYLSIMLGTLIVSRIYGRRLPFSVDFEITEKGGFMEMISSLFVMGILFGLHLLFQRISYGIYIYLFTIILADIIAWSYVFKTETN